MKSRAILGAMLLSAIFIMGQANANLLINGSFEEVTDEAQVSASISGVATDSTLLTGWTVTHAGIDLIGSWWQASSGARSLDLNGNDVGGIAQTFSTISGQLYQVQFEQAANRDGGIRISQLGVQAAGQSEQYSFDNTGSTHAAMGWITRTWDFTANENTTTLAFYSLDTETPLYGPALDNVIVTAIPEPCTIALLGLGMVMLRRKR